MGPHFTYPVSAPIARTGIIRLASGRKCSKPGHRSLVATARCGADCNVSIRSDAGIEHRTDSDQSIFAHEIETLL
jgi:hypothetical protein